MLSREGQSNTIFHMYLSNLFVKTLVSHLWVLSGLDSQLSGLLWDTLLLSRAYHYVLVTFVQLYHEQIKERRCDSCWFTKVALNAFLFSFPPTWVSLAEMPLCIKYESMISVISYPSSNKTELKWTSFAWLQPIHFAVEYKGQKKIRKKNLA